jgi:fatty acid desaturase
VIFTQFAFLGHEASHRQIFESGRANDRSGLVLAALVGMSYGWWMNKHSRHHANPNKIGKDPDIAADTVSFLEESAVTRRGVLAWITRRQGYLFFPLLLLEGVNLHVKSILSLSASMPVKGRWIELIMLAARFLIYFGLIFWLLPFGMAWAFIGVQLAVFGLYMGATFAPNHKGMPIVPADVKLDFLSKQVRTSRNISGGWWATILMGGLNYQIEHHLFPSMPRPHLRAARILPQQRRPVRRKQPALVVSDRRPVPEPRRARRPRPLRLSVSEPAATWLSLRRGGVATARARGRARPALGRARARAAGLRCAARRAHRTKPPRRRR